MKQIKIIFLASMWLLTGPGIPSSAQEKTNIPEEQDAILEEQLENLEEADEEAIMEDDDYEQELLELAKHPVNLNSADVAVLVKLYLVSSTQLNNLIAYRKLLGNLIDIYEIQAIPGWTPDVIRKVKPFVTIATSSDVGSSLRSRFKTGEHMILFRETRILERSKGYLLDENQPYNYYYGSPDKLLLKYRYRAGNLLQYGITAEKDAGEEFFKGSQKNGFDFYSAHLFIRNIGMIKALALGDFSVNLGQGLVQWQGMGFKKGINLLNVKRQSDILRPYHSAGEIVFNRGMGVMLQKKRFQLTTFGSWRRVDAGFHEGTADGGSYISSLQTSGYHRTRSELDNKGKQRQLSFGGNLSYSGDQFYVGINGVHYLFKYPLVKEDNLYNRYALSGKDAGNYSIDYNYTYKNAHFFGEAAIDERGYKAFVNGLLINLDANASMSFLYRKVHEGYQALYANAFTENANPSNESGFYSGITLKPASVIRIDAYADFFHFPWLKYRVDAPSTGHEYLLQLTYTPDKYTELYGRYKSEDKAVNFNPDDLPLNPVVSKLKQSVRVQLGFKPLDHIILRSRVDLLWYDIKGDNSQRGFLAYSDIIYKPALQPFSCSFRLLFFETDGYDSRIYTYENDVLYGYSIPAFFDKGYRYYINMRLDINKKLSIWSRFAQTIYSDRKIIGSGLDQINRNTKSEVKVQLRYLLK